MNLKKNIWVSLYILRVVEYPTLSLYKHLSLKQIKYSSFAKLFLVIAAIGTKYHTSITCTYRHTQTCQQRSYSNSYLWRRHLSFCFFFLIFPISKYFFPIFFLMRNMCISKNGSQVLEKMRVENSQRRYPNFLQDGVWGAYLPDNSYCSMESLTSHV